MTTGDRLRGGRQGAATLVVESVVSQVEGMNHRGWVLRKRRGHLLREIPEDEQGKKRRFLGQSPYLIANDSEMRWRSQSGLTSFSPWKLSLTLAALFSMCTHRIKAHLCFKVVCKEVHLTKKTKNGRYVFRI